MIRAGLTGGLASGKSVVSRELESLGCFVIHADHLGHLVLAPDGEAYAGVLREFGAGIVNAEGKIDKRRLASEVFGNPERLAILNSLVHPPVFAREDRLLEAAERRDPHGIAVVEAAILIESGSYKRFRPLLLASCPEALQEQRAAARDGMTLEEARARIRHQMPLAEKRKYADYVIDTSGALEWTLEQTRQVYRQLRSIEG